MFLKSFLVVLIAAFNCATLNSTQEKRLPEIRFLKAEKGKHENTYWFYFIKNNADSNLLIKLRAANSDSSTIELGFNCARTKDTANILIDASTHTEWLSLNNLKDTVIVHFQFNPHKGFKLVGGKFTKRRNNTWQFGTYIFYKDKSQEKITIWSDAIPQGR